jgi:hypothetical protein
VDRLESYLYIDRIRIEKKIRSIRKLLKLYLDFRNINKIVLLLIEPEEVCGFVRLPLLYN